ncbi:hypothetical protein R3P38DRAFT_3211610 [Favolaschia claudopus]|uniref:Integrase catalytic domain-containing protein n=1 Tax=Favolaschia claudopus TaxID=2862362 RepID=A0AAW0AF09_9AGAR
MSNIPRDFPPLPHAPWPPNVVLAYQRIKGAFDYGLTLFEHETGNEHQLTAASEGLVNDVVPLLDQLELDGVPRAFTEACANVIGPLACELKLAALAAQGIDRRNVVFVDPVEEIHTGKRGRPEKRVNVDLMKEAFASDRNISKKAFAASLGIHRTVLAKKMKAAGIKKKYDPMTDEDLDVFVSEHKAAKPANGRRYIVAALRNRGLRIQKERVRKSLARVDALGQMLRKKTIRRRTYSVPRPNHLWHCDGHHKLILWGFVIHGFVDGYCRTITGMRASTNNRASTVLDVFKEAIAIYGTPYRVRGDRGGENVKVSVWMILHRGPNRASFMWGSSTHNTRIERLWVEVGTQFARPWRAFFIRLGDLHRLDRKNAAHIWLLHLLFLDSLNADCREFQELWNRHPISGRQGNDQSPKDMRFQGMLDSGEYIDPMQGIHPDTIDRYYGVEGPEVVRQPGQTGAGHEEDEDENAWVDEPEGLVDAVTDDLAHNIRHPPVKVAKHKNPFRLATTEQAFYNALNEYQTNNVIPEGYGVLEAEWEDEMYPVLESINPGTRGKELIIALPRDIWLPRAILFVQALDVMTRCIWNEEASLGPREAEDDDVSSSSSDEDIDD